MTDIAINGRFLTQRQTGVQRYARELLLAWAARRAPSRGRPRVLVPAHAALEREEAFEAAFAVTPVGRLRGHAWEQAELRVHAQGGFLINLCNAAPVRRTEQLVAIHDAAVWRCPQSYGWRFRTLYKFLLPRIARASRSIVTVSRFSAEELSGLLGLALRAIEIVPNGGDHILRVPSDSETLARHDLAPGRYFLAVGSANPSKNLAFLRYLEPLLGASRLRLVIAGGLTPHVFSRSSGSRDSAIRSIGHVSDSALRALYEGAMAFVFPSRYEGFGIPPLEAMFCGCPVLASSAASIPEVCGKGAAYFDPHDPASLIKLSERVIESAAQREELRAAGRERAGHFTWARSAEALEAVLPAV